MSDYIIFFGKYKGQDISMVPRGYLYWVQENMIDSDDSWLYEKEKELLNDEIERELAQRDRSHVDW